MARASRGRGNNWRLGIAPPGSRSDIEICLSGLSATPGADFEVVCVFQSEKKKKSLSRNPFFSPFRPVRLSASAFSSYRRAVSPKQTLGITVGFTHKAERIFFGEFAQGRYLGAEHAHVICRKGCTSEIAAKRREWSVVFWLGIWVLRAVCLSGISDEGAR